MEKNIKFSVFVPIKEKSERVKNKNFRLILGEPLYSYILKTLLSIDIIDDLVINTDSDYLIGEIKSRFNDKRVKIIKRDENLIGGFISVDDLILSNINDFKNENIIQTHVTNPLLKKETLLDSMKKYIELNEHDSLVSVNKIQKRLYYKNGDVVNICGNKSRTQDLDPIYERNANIYIFKKNDIIKNKNRLGKNPYYYVMSKIESIDIDEEEDLLVAELLIKNKKENDRRNN
jgi:N-acylneuraminate cytidylyltransferase